MLFPACSNAQASTLWSSENLAKAYFSFSCVFNPDVFPSADKKLFLEFLDTTLSNEMLLSPVLSVFLEACYHISHLSDSISQWERLSFLWVKDLEVSWPNTEASPTSSLQLAVPQPPSTMPSFGLASLSNEKVLQASSQSTKEKKKSIKRCSGFKIQSPSLYAIVGWVMPT